MRRRSTLLLISVMIFCFAMPGCKYIVKKKLRKLKEGIEELVEASQVEVIGFWSGGCIPCRKAKTILANAGIQINWIEVNCYNRRMVAKYKIKVTPTFIIKFPAGDIKTSSPRRVIGYLTNAICAPGKGCCP